jgi:hypothetical protein
MDVFAGTVLAAAGKLEEAEARLSAAVAVARRARREPTLLGLALDGASDVARRRGDAARAVALGGEALDVLRRTSGTDHPATALAAVHYGAALSAAGRREDGERHLRGGLEGLEKSLPPNHADLAAARRLLEEASARRVSASAPLSRE